MTETGNIVSISSIVSLILIFFSAAGPTLQAQDFTLEATVSENRIFIGEQFTVSVEVSGSSMRGVSLPVLPRIEGVGVLNSTPSRSTSISIVNGRTTTSTTYTFSLVAREQGNFTIPPISIEIDGETYTTNSIPIEIIERRNLSQGEGRQLPDIFLEIEVDHANPVPGQQIVASLNLYFKQGVEITSFQPSGGWRTDGFWKEELQNIRQPQAESVILNGVRYRKATLIRYALFPSRSGSFTLAEFPLNVGIRTQPQRNDPFGSFFGSGTNQRRVSVESEPVEITVRPLPAAQNAISMNAVGDLRVDRRLNLNEVKTGETIELITKVEGTGNIPLVRRPGYNLPDGLDRYTPQESSNVERRGLNIRGEKTFTELIVARAPGTYTIPEERVAVYDPDGGRYRYITLPALSFEARPAPGTPVVTASTTAGSLTPINGLAIWHNQPAGPLHQTTWFWILLALPALALIVGLQQKHHRHRMMTDSGFARAQRAVENAKERISNARQAVDNRQPKECYHLLHKAITGFITDKMGLPEAGFSDAELIERIKEKGAGEDLLKQLKGMLDKCATISYAPAGSADDQLADTDRTEKVISELRKLL